jgi:hypothetical protein
VAQAVRIPWGFPEVFVISQTALPALLYLPGSQGMRLSLRVAAFAISLLAYGWWQLQNDDRRIPHPANEWVIAALGLLGAMLFNPLTPSLLGGAAHLAVYFAVIAPVFWAPALVRTPEHLARLLGLVLICSGVNSAVGVLQVYDPDRWMPAELSRIVTESAVGLGPVTYQGPDGRIIVRPPGLFDTPGAVAGPGMFAALLGLVFGLSAIPLWQRLAAFAAAAAGVAAIYLSHVRISMGVLVIMMTAYAFVLLRQGRVGKATTFGTLAGTVVVMSFMLAVTLGGESVFSRFVTMFAEDPLNAYYRSRGFNLSYTLAELFFNFPLGAGLARWGMAAGYFGGSGTNALWAEIQITGWMIDGGFLLVFAYGGALVATAISHFRLAGATGHPRLAACAAVIFAANLGTATMVASYTPFVAQIGIQYWFLAGALHGVVRQYHGGRA